MPASQTAALLIKRDILIQWPFIRYNLTYIFCCHIQSIVIFKIQLTRSMAAGSLNLECISRPHFLEIISALCLLISPSHVLSPVIRCTIGSYGTSQRQWPDFSCVHSAVILVRSGSMRHVRVPQGSYPPGGRTPPHPVRVTREAPV